MKKTMHSLVLSFFLLLSSNAFALEGKKENRFLQKMEQQLDQTQVEVLADIEEASDEELLEKYGDVILELVFIDSPILTEVGISLNNNIRENVELLYSDAAKEFLLSSAETKLSELGSLKAFNKAVKKNEKLLKSKNKGFFRAIGRFMVDVVSIITLPFFFIFGPWGWVYWAVLFGHWS